MVKSVFVSSSSWGQQNEFIRRYADKFINDLIKENDTGIGSAVFQALQIESLYHNAQYIATYIAVLPHMRISAHTCMGSLIYAYTHMGCPYMYGTIRYLVPYKYELQLASCVFYFACYIYLHTGLQLLFELLLSYRAAAVATVYIRVWDSPICVWDCAIAYIYMELSNSPMHI